VPVLPLPYHREVAALLERENPASFAALAPTTRVLDDELDQSLLRSTYRLEAAAHPRVEVATSRATAVLEVTVPVEAYAAAGSEPNVELVFVPDRAVLVFTGGSLEVVDDDELAAVVAHELAHHQLWTTDGSRYLAAMRLLDAAESDARTPAEYLETARRFRLATEVYADRAALAVTGDPTAAVSGLLKLTTGLTAVDPGAYLRQAAEVDFTRPSAGATHPETVLRAWALQSWAAAPGDEADAQILAAFGPDLDLATLDLPGQDRLRGLTRDLVQVAVTEPALRSADVLELAGQYGVEPAAPSAPASLPPLSGLPEETRRFLAAVLADLATADPDADRAALVAVLVVARRCGLGPDLLHLLSAELELAERERNRLGELVDAATAEVA